MGLSGTTFVLLGLLVCAGAFVQRIAGFGLAVVAPPFVVTFAPQVMPAANLLVVLPLPVVEILRNGRDILWRPFGWAIGFRALTCRSASGSWRTPLATPYPSGWPSWCSSQWPGPSPACGYAPGP